MDCSFKIIVDEEYDRLFLTEVDCKKRIMEKYRPFTPFAFNVSYRPTRAFLTSSSKRIAMNMRAIIVSVS